jgi:glycosyltransferase involved in cell wall biosynthesis
MGGTAWQEVKDAAANFSNIHIIEKNMSRSEIWGLIRLSDVFVSLHRSEGVGLSMLEAMRLGRPVIATGWSGNLDFMENHSAFLIGYRFIDALDERGTYSVPGSQWAEPEVTEAAAAMRLLADDASLRFRIGCAGRQRVADLTLHECGLRALRALCLTNLTQM